MTRQRYSFRESLNRILRLLENKADPSDAPNTLSGEVLSTDEAISDLAELLAGSLPNESLVVPGGFSLTNYTASYTDVLEGDVMDEFVTPASLNASQGYGELYTYTGTSTFTNLPAQTYTLITGAFFNSYGDGENILTPTAGGSQILIFMEGSYFVQWHMDIIGSSDINYAVTPFMNSGTVYQAIGSCRPYSSGTIASMSGAGIVEVPNALVSLDLRVYPGQTAWMRVLSAQLNAFRIKKMKDDLS